MTNQEKFVAQLLDKATDRIIEKESKIIMSSMYGKNGEDKMKSLNIKIPLSIAKVMDNSAQLNPMYITGFVITHINKVKDVLDKPINELSYNYTFKVHNDLHKIVKLVSVEQDIPMNELIGRLLAAYYGVRHG